jgi:hypothetical protein
MATHLADPHSLGLATSTALSEYYVEDIITPVRVITALNRAGIRYVLVGAHGISGWLAEPRATKDVDVLMAVRGVRKAVTVLTTAFPALVVDDQEVVARLRHKDTQQVLIDVMKANQPLHRVALKYANKATREGHTYLVPSLELALALKFGPMVSLTRVDEKKHLDAHDFISMVKHNSQIDLKKLSTLGDLVYPGGGREVVELVRKVRAGEKLVL